MSRASRRSACRRWGHLPAGSRRARCGSELRDQTTEHRIAWAVVAVVVAILVGVTIGHMLMPLDLARP